jgi:hypothetical protein
MGWIVGKGSWTRSTIEEVIAALWTIAAVISFGFSFDTIGWVFSIKAASDTVAAIWVGWQEAIAGKRSNTK